MKRKKYEICPNCDASLDSGEHCDCLEKEQETEYFWTGITQQGTNGQVLLKIGNQEGIIIENY